ncbi:hypothetical protein EMIHUDRAFT_422320, partial [Emiliania huxleyi CCMP1516]|uniref:PAS domain-containing protein n=2 Tax=Emiliania huxleyi TaxID=2903 RepID=A0A0D3IGX5_EMIH1
MDDWSLSAELGSPPRALDLLMHECTSAAVVVDEHNKILACNAKWVAMCGYTPAEALGKSPRMLQGPLTDQGKAKLFAEEVRARGGARAMLANYCKDGIAFVHALSATRVTDRSTGHVLYFTEGRHVKEPAVCRAILKTDRAASTTAATTTTNSATPSSSSAAAAIGIAIAVAVSGAAVAAGGHVSSLPRLLLLPSAIPLAIVVLSLAVVATEKFPSPHVAPLLGTFSEPARTLLGADLAEPLVAPSPSRLLSRQERGGARGGARGARGGLAGKAGQRRRSLRSAHLGRLQQG